MEWYVIRKKDNSNIRVVRADKLKLGKNDRIICVCQSQQSAERERESFLRDVQELEILLREVQHV